MSKVSTYLNFARNTEQAFEFYRSVFGGEYVWGIHRFRDIPPAEGVPTLSEEDKNLIMHVALPIMDGHLLMGTDAPESMGFQVRPGNNVYVSLEPDTRAEADEIFAKLSANGTIHMPLADIFWGAYYGSLVDQFGVQWMINCTGK